MFSPEARRSVSLSSPNLAAALSRKAAMNFFQSDVNEHVNKMSSKIEVKDTYLWMSWQNWLTGEGASGLTDAKVLVRLVTNVATSSGVDDTIASKNGREKKSSRVNQLPPDVDDIPENLVEFSVMRPNAAKIDA